MTILQRIKRGEFGVSRRARGAVALALCMLAMSTTLLAATPTYPEPPFLPPAGHPRVYFRSSDLSRLRANATQPQNAAAFAAHREALGSTSDGVLPSVKSGESNADTRVLSVIESRAFEFALNGDTAQGRRAVASLQNYLRTVRYTKKDYDNRGQTVFVIGAVYDWCYPLLSADERTRLIEAGLATAGDMEIGWPPVQQGNVTGHGPEGQVQRDLLALAVATFDERPEIYRWVAGRIFDRFVAPKRFMYPAHMHHQGSHYVNYRFQWEMLCTWMFDRMGRPQIYGPDQQFVMYWSLYARRPDGQVLRDGDTHINNRPLGEYYTGPVRPTLLAANYFQDPYLKTAALRQNPQLEPLKRGGNQVVSAVELLVFNDPTLAGRPLEELPLTKYFPSPKGGMIARTGWEEGLGSGAVVAEFKINEWYFSNHQHLDAGAFQIYYRGALATDTGYYQAAVKSDDITANDGNTRYGSMHDINYHKRTIAHNTIVVRDPKESFRGSGRWKSLVQSNDGGQRLPNNWDEPREHEEFIDPANGYRIGEVLGHGFGPERLQPSYSYLKGDLRRAYSAKIRAFERSFVFLNLKQAAHPAALVVFDRVVSADKNFPKAWLLHGLEEPTISGPRVVFRDTRPGYTGKLTVDTLLPKADDLHIEKIGGPGREFWVDGVNYPAKLQAKGVNEGSGWRIEVSPRAKRETDYFLHVLQVGDHTPDTPALAVERLESPTHLGLAIADRVVMFGRERERSGANVDFAVVGGEGEREFVVADLSAGNWSIECDGKTVGAAKVSAEEGVACFRGSAGRYRLTREK